MQHWGGRGGRRLRQQLRWGAPVGPKWRDGDVMAGVVVLMAPAVKVAEVHMPL